MDYLRIRNWDKWQSYRRDRGRPPWIKVHRRLLQDPQWATLTDVQRGHLVSLWILAADRDGAIPSDPNLCRKLCFLDSTPDLQAFMDKGFIERGAKVTSTWRQDDANVTPNGRQHDAPEAKAEAEAEADIGYYVPSCAFCNARAGDVGKPLTVDLLIPKAAGGTDSEENQVANCQICKQLRKGIIGSVDEIRTRIHWNLWAKRSPKYVKARERMFGGVPPDGWVPPDKTFDVFWDAYPRKVGKGDALESWRKLNPTADTIAAIMQAVQAQKESLAWRKENGRYIPNPATWLNQKRWGDQLDSAPAGEYAGDNADALFT